VMDHSPETVGVFDLVLCLGVLYHMRHPLLALEKVASVTGRQLILETHVDMLEHKRPAGAFYPGGELNSDPSNWWGLNPAAIEAMLKEVGFREVRTVSCYHRAPLYPPRPFARRLAGALKARVLRKEPFFQIMAHQGMTRARMVFHAFR